MINVKNPDFSGWHTNMALRAALDNLSVTRAWISWAQAHRTRGASEEATVCGSGGMASRQQPPGRGTCARRLHEDIERRVSRTSPVVDIGEDRGVDQQFGRTRNRDWAGSTGKAGRSEAGKRLAFRFLMDRLLRCSLKIRGVTVEERRSVPTIADQVGLRQRFVLYSHIGL
jgi:hypothetical protein